MKEERDSNQRKVAIACGGTGGHFFPGVAVAQEVRRRGGQVQVMLFASRKEVDRESAGALPDARIEFLPAVALHRGRRVAFVWGVIRSLALCLRRFLRWKPEVVLVMGGFSGVAPAIAGRLLGARVYLHESNSVPGRANRYLAPLCRGIFVGLPSAKEDFGGRKVVVSGTPVRKEFRQALRPEICRRLGLASGSPILLVMGGSQGARALNDLMAKVAPLLSRRHPDLQIIHLTGKHDHSSLRTLYEQLGLRYFLSEFCPNVSELIQLATAVLSRAGAASLAEYAVVRLPALLIPYPHAVDDHQRKNALIFAESGAAEWREESHLQASDAVRVLSHLLYDQESRRRMKKALRAWDAENAAARIADDLMKAENSEWKASEAIRGGGGGGGAKEKQRAMMPKDRRISAQAPARRH